MEARGHRCRSIRCMRTLGYTQRPLCIRVDQLSSSLLDILGALCALSTHVRELSDSVTGLMDLCEQTEGA